MLLSKMNFRFAVPDDCSQLAAWNRELIRDEGHRNRMPVRELEQRMRGWLAGEYRATIFEDGGETVAYVLFREQPEKIYLRQLFVLPQFRRKEVGRRCLELLREKALPKDKRLTEEVLVGNTAAVAFWRAVGFADYSLALELMPPARLDSVT